MSHVKKKYECCFTEIQLAVNIARLPKFPGVLSQTCLILRRCLKAFYKMRVFIAKCAFLIIKYSNSETVWKDTFNALAERSWQITDEEHIVFESGYLVQCARYTPTSTQISHTAFTSPHWSLLHVIQINLQYACLNCLYEAVSEKIKIYASYRIALWQGVIYHDTSKM